MPQWNLNLDKKTFLADYWQRDPLLIRNAIPGFVAPLEADDLAGMALEESIESRIIEFRNSNWQLEQGPFVEQSFDRKNPWTLLVQSVDHYVDEVAELLRLVDFIPRWRVDDIMVSYAVDGGSAGPHYDHYDVFLLQAQGQREWRLGQRCDENSALKPDTDLKILEDFACDTTHVLYPGDILYVPPGVAHWGIAKGECMTYSIGFRAPAMSEILSRGVDACLESLSSGTFYQDPDLGFGHRPGEIRPEDSRRAIEQLVTTLTQHGDTRWFGELLTEPKHEAHLPTFEPGSLLARALERGDGLLLSPAAKVAWQETDSGIVVFANGESTHYEEAALPLLMVLCREGFIKSQQLREALNSFEGKKLLEHLLEVGCLEPRY